MNRLNIALVCIGLSIALLAATGGVDRVTALVGARSWSDAMGGWVCRLPEAAPFALLGLGIGAVLVVLGRKA